MSLETRLAWRNVWRNPRRTGLCVAATVFAVYLVVLSVAMGAGTHEKMIEDGVRLQTGHVTIAGAGWIESRTLEQFVPFDEQIEAVLESTPGLRGWAPRVTSCSRGLRGQARRARAETRPMTLPRARAAAWSVCLGEAAVASSCVGVWAAVSGPVLRAAKCST